MGRRRGFFAELQYQNQLAAKQRAQAERAAAREYARRVREAEQAQRQAERAAAQAQRATVAEQKAAEKEAKRLRLEARAAEVEALNARLAETASELDSLLSATLGVDDYVDLDTLRVIVEHPPFDGGELETPTPTPAPISAPPEPAFVEPEAPKGLGSIFGGKKKHAEAVAAARATFEAEHKRWTEEAAAVLAQQLAQVQEHEEAERRRLEQLDAARKEYERECEAREAEAANTNDRLAALKAGVAAGQPDAIQEYVGIVLGNSVYPELLDVQHEFEFDPVTRELTLTVLIAPPDRLPQQKAYRYVKASDEIVATPLSKKDLKDRYASIVHEVAVRSLHEIFEADRTGWIRTITLELGTETTNPATGRDERVVFVGVAAERDAFSTFDLQNVVPVATLEHLGAAISKNPVELAGIGKAPGVRTR